MYVFRLLHAGTPAIVTSATTLQALRFTSHFSTRYLVTGEPPSCLGGCHDSVTLSAVMSLTSSGPTGALGTSGERGTGGWVSLVYCTNLFKVFCEEVILAYNNHFRQLKQGMHRSAKFQTLPNAVDLL